MYGDGRQRREWLHAADHCAAIELVLREGAPGEVYNVGGEEFENIEVTRRIVELTGADPGLITHVDDRAGHDRRYALDDAKLRALGWQPEHSFGETGLAETVAWYRENRAWCDAVKSGEYRAYYDRSTAHGSRTWRPASATTQGFGGLRREHSGSLRVASARGPCPCGRSQPS